MRDIFSQFISRISLIKKPRLVTMPICIILFLGLTQVFFAFSSEQNETMCVYTWDDNGNKRLSRLMYDSTAPISKIWKKHPLYFCDHTMESLGMQVCFQSYYRIAPQNASTTPYNIRKYFQPFLFDPSHGELPEVGVVFKETDACRVNEFLNIETNISLKYYPDAFIFNYMDVGQDCNKVCSDAWIRVSDDYMKQPGASLLRTGIQLTERMMDCVLNHCYYRFQQNDWTVLNVTLPPITSLLSYQGFVKKLSAILSEKVSVIKGYNEYNEFYFLLSANHLSSDIIGDANLFRAMLTKYADLWATNEVKAQFILDTFPPNTMEQLNLLNNLENIIPYYRNEINVTQVAFETSCQLPRALEFAGSLFENLVLEIDSVDDSTLVKKCNQMLTFSGNSTASLTVKVNSEMDAIKLLGKLTDLNFQTVYVQPQSNDSTFLLIYSLAKSLNISVACVDNYYVSQQNWDGPFHIGSNYYNYCSSWFEHNPFAVLEWRKGKSIDSHEYLSYLLSNSLAMRETFLKKYPTGKMHLRFHLFDLLNHFSNTYYRFNLYCTTITSPAVEFQQSAISWAQINNFVTIMEPLVDLSETTGWWFSVLTEDNLNRSATDFPILLRRNLPERKLSGNITINTHPCLYKTERLDNLPFPQVSEFTGRIYSGITLDLNLIWAPFVSIPSIQNFLAVSFGKFTNVEVRGIQNYIEMLPPALAENLYNALLPRKIDQGNLHLYIEFTDIKSFRASVDKLITLDFPLSGVHIYGWENHSGATAIKLEEAMRYFHNPSTKVKSPPKYGLVIQNCTYEINSGMQRLISLSYIRFLNYFVCIVPPTNPLGVKRDQTQFYLDTQFYIQQYFLAKLNISTYFRLTLSHRKLAKNQAKTDDYLVFMNDTNQYAEGYGIKYFMGNAFSDGNLNLWSWWNLTNGTDAGSKIPKITELVSDYFGQPTVQKYKVLPLNNIQKYVPLVIGLSIFSILSIAAVGALWVYNRRMKIIILTHEEVAAFRNGEEVSRSEESIGGQYVQVNTIKTLGFSSAFEIPKKTIQLGAVIGQGNFGVVYTAFFKDEIQVAVKIPHSDCSKESFKTILAEVKILCYIGNHQNVISFIGAYTKEIDRGVVYVVTEYCQNGSLEKYLTKLKRKAEAKNCVIQADSSNIGYVTNVQVAQPSPQVSEKIEFGEFLKFCYEIVCGMDFIARKKVVHADLSTRNILLDSEMTCKIGDFGLSRKLYESNEYIKKGEEALPWRWMAVESLRKMEFTTKSDVWSFGVTLWEIFSLGETPYSGITWNPDFVDELENGLRLKKPQRSPQEIYTKMLQCWNISSTERPTFPELRNSFETYVLKYL